MSKKKSDKTNHYVDNEKFCEAMVDWLKEVKKAEKKGKPRPKVPDYIGMCLLEIATNLSYKPNFINYQYRDDMVMDGVENCLQYITNFDPEKSNNPFSYFTQISYWAFVRRIEREKKQLYVKYKSIQDGIIHDDEVTATQYGSDHANSQMEQFIQQFEEKKEAKKKAKKKTKKSKSAITDLINEVG